MSVRVAEYFYWLPIKHARKSFARSSKVHGAETEIKFNLYITYISPIQPAPSFHVIYSGNTTGGELYTNTSKQFARTNCWCVLMCAHSCARMLWHAYRC